MLYAALVSWAVARVMDAILPIVAEVLKTTWENTMKLVKLVVRSVEMLAINNICSAVIVVGVPLERLAHVQELLAYLASMTGYKYAPLRGVNPYGQLLLHSFNFYVRSPRRGFGELDCDSR